MMNRLERIFKKRLDEEEENLLLQIERWLKQVVDNIPASVTFEQVSTFVLPGAGLLAPILANYAADIYSIGQAHAGLEVEGILKKAGRKLAEEDFLLPNVPKFEIWIKPVEAIKALQARQLILAGDFEADLLTQTKQALMERLLGASRKDVEQRLQDVLRVNRNRAGLITTTETTYAYNRGRLAGFHAHGVDYVQFSAILDKRTSAQCRTRHGLIMVMDDPRLPANTPPLHGRCRSILKPVYGKYQGKEITHKSLDWSDAAPLPKGWRTGGETISPAITIPEMIIIQGGVSGFGESYFTSAPPRPKEVIDEALDRIKKDKIKLTGVDKINNLAEAWRDTGGFIMINDLKTIYICSRTWDTEYRDWIIGFIDNARSVIGQGKFTRKTFDKLVNKLYQFDFADMTARTIKHEYGHILSFTRSHLLTGTEVDIARQYDKYLQILHQRGIDTTLMTRRALYEIIAEDLRIAMGGNDAVLPSVHTWESDLPNPKLAQKARKELIHILGLRGF